MASLGLNISLPIHDDVIKWKHFPYYWTFVRDKGQWHGALFLIFFIWAWTNGLVNNGDADDLRRHRAHYDVTLMLIDDWINSWTVYLYQNSHQCHISMLCNCSFSECNLNLNLWQLRHDSYHLRMFKCDWYCWKIKYCFATLLLMVIGDGTIPWVLSMTYLEKTRPHNSCGNQHWFQGVNKWLHPHKTLGRN